jgi:5'-3' exonuclease
MQSVSQHNRPILLVDAYNLFTRHFIANPAMSSHGMHVGGVYGFMKSIARLADMLNPTDIYVVWEGGGSIRRRAIYSNYKHRRKPQKLNRFYGDDIPDTKENRSHQVALAIELLKTVPIKQVYVSDCEADDVIAYLAKNKFNDKKCVIISSDKDYYQLLSKRIIQWSPGQKDFVTAKDVIRKFGMYPENFIVARCFCGDGSDALPGIKGAGFKTMLKRFPELGKPDFISVDEVVKLSYERSSGPGKNIKLFQNINEDPEIPQRNWKLMYLGILGLSGNQVQKVEGIIDTFDSPGNKIKLMKALIREGMSTFDADSFYMSITSTLGTGK